MKQQTARLVIVISVIFSMMLPASGVAAQSRPEPREVVRIYYTDITKDIERLASFDLFEYNNKSEKYLLAAVDAEERLELAALGFRLETDLAETAAFKRTATALPGQVNGIPGYPCYRTVEETYAAAQAIVAAYPALASWVDVGDTWQKSVGLGGYDLMALKLTNSAVAGPKPKLFVTSSIHAREYTPAELVTRFAEYMVANYGVNPDVTWILDYHELNLLLQANPDGRKQAETGLSWRKNTNQNYCSPTSNLRGADLNRNFDYHWGGAGASTSQCSETYRGPSAASEPETQAIQATMQTLFPDQRGGGDLAAAPADATGLYIDIHSYSQLVLWPWGFTATPAPNGAALQTLGRKLAYFNNYEPEQSVGLYPTTGTTDDFGYGELGVASYTFELGTSFFQGCSSFENTIYPDNLDALLFAAKVVRTPYLTPAGPDALVPTLDEESVTAGDSVLLTATLNDTRFNNRNGTEPSQAIIAGEATIDTPPWEAAKRPASQAMFPVDGNFDSPVEMAAATLDTGSLSIGRHMVYVRGQDADGNWGPVSAAFLTVTEPAAPDFTLSASPAGQTICAPAPASYQVNATAFLGFADPLTLSASGQPSGTVALFALNPITPPTTSTLTISNTAAAQTGSYAISISGVATTRTHTTTVQLDLYSSLPASVTLTAPADGLMDVAPRPTFTWEPLADATSYDFEIAGDSAFSNVVASKTGLLASELTLDSYLDTSSLYFWRMRANNGCGSGSYSPANRFVTEVAAGDCGLDDEPAVLFRDDFETPKAGWTHDGDNDTWTLWSDRVRSGEAAYHATNLSAVSDQRLVSPPVDLPADASDLTLQFWNYQDFENRTGGCYDGGILEISSDNGDTWTQITAGLQTDPYDGPVSTAYSNPLGGLDAWCGAPQDWLNSVVDLAGYAGETVRFRFRVGTDTGINDEGWSIDDVKVQACRPACRDMDGSGRVDNVDIQTVAGHWGEENLSYDFNLSGSVDVDDILAVAGQWGDSCAE